MKTPSGRCRAKRSLKQTTYCILARLQRSTKGSERQDGGRARKHHPLIRGRRRTHRVTHSILSSRSIPLFAGTESVKEDAPV